MGWVENEEEIEKINNNSIDKDNYQLLYSIKY
jgi:hypothetical protein